jgi:mono/diheme cytochrome c family protein
MQRPGLIFVFGAIVGVTLFALAGAVCAWVWLGRLDVSATGPTSRLLTAPAHLALTRQLEREAAGPPEPPAPSGRRLVLGFRQYDGACASCHGTPSEGRAVWAKAMNPVPPDFTETPRRLPLKRLYWLICRGEALSGMPAFGQQRSDDDIWDLALFLAALPSMKPEAYLRMRSDYGPAPKPFDLTPNARCFKASS